MNKTLRVAAIACVLTVSGFLMNYFFIVLPNEKKDINIAADKISFAGKKETENEVLSNQDAASEEDDRSQLIDFESYKEDKSAPNTNTELKKNNPTVSQEEVDDLEKEIKKAKKAYDKTQKEIADAEDEQRLQYVERIKDEYDSKYDSLLKSCNTAYNSIEATKYW